MACAYTFNAMKHRSTTHAITLMLILLLSACTKDTSAPQAKKSTDSKKTFSENKEQPEDTKKKPEDTPTVDEKQPPIIGNLQVTNEGKEITVELMVQDPDSDPNDIKAVYVVKDQGEKTKLEDVDWTQGISFEHQEPLHFSVEKEAAYDIFVQVIDESDHAASTHKTITIGNQPDPKSELEVVQTTPDDDYTIIIMENPKHLQLIQNPTLSEATPVAINAGLINSKNKLVGAFAQSEPNATTTIKPINPKDMGGPFESHNGVLALKSDGTLHVFAFGDTELKRDFVWAFQNGPILVHRMINLHEAGGAKKKRSGIGHTPDNKLVFIKTEKELDLYDFGALFKKHNVHNALYLDGNDEQRIGFELLDFENQVHLKDDGVDNQRFMLTFSDTNIWYDIIQFGKSKLHPDA